MFIWIILAPLS